MHRIASNVTFFQSANVLAHDAACYEYALCNTYSSVLVFILKANLPKVRLPMHNVKAITDYRMSKITCIKFCTIIEKQPFWQRRIHKYFKKRKLKIESELFFLFNTLLKKVILILKCCRIL